MEGGSSNLKIIKIKESDRCEPCNRSFEKIEKKLDLLLEMPMENGFFLKNLSVCLG